MKLLDMNDKNILISTDIFIMKNIESLFGDNKHLDFFTNDVVRCIDAYIEPSCVGKVRSLIEQNISKDGLLIYLTENNIVKFLTFGKPDLTQRVLINILIEEDKNVLLEQFITLNSCKKHTTSSKFISQMLSSFFNIDSKQEHSMFMSFLNKKPTYVDLNNSSVTLSEEYDAKDIQNMIAEYHETKNILNDIQEKLILRTNEQSQIDFIQSDIFVCTLIAIAQRFENPKEKLTQLLKFMKKHLLFKFVKEHLKVDVENFKIFDDPLKISYFVKETEQCHFSYKQRFLQNFIMNLFIEINVFELHLLRVNDKINIEEINKINIEKIWQNAKNEI